MKNRVFKKNNSGITLVALVVTIIVVIILAGISIATLSGENGIINRAYQAKDATELAQLKEELLERWYAFQNDHIKEYLPNVKTGDQDGIQELFQKFLRETAGDENATVSYKDANETFEVYFKGHYFEISAINDKITNNWETGKRNVASAWNQAKNSSTDRDTQLEKLIEILKELDPSSEVTVDGDKIKVTHNGYTYEINPDDEDNNITRPEDGGVVPTDRAKVEIASSPDAKEVFEGTDATFTVNASGKNLTYQWYVNNDNRTVGGAAIDGATNSTYTKTGTTVASDDGKYYYCIVTSTLNGRTNTDKTTPAKLTVIKRMVASQITAEVSAEVVEEGDSVELSVTVDSAVKGALLYQWYKDGTAIDGATSSTYKIEKTTEDDDAYYYCVVTQTVGSEKEEIQTDKLKVNVKISTSITSQPKATGAIAGQSAEVSVTVKGNGTIEYQWYKDGTAINGATSSTYKINETATTDSGDYYCVISQTFNGVKTTTQTDTVAITVVEKLSITAAPIAQTATEGLTASFSVTATGGGTIEYQWYKDGAAIDGATNATYNISRVELSHAGDYTVKVTQTYNSQTEEITTTAVALTVNEVTISASETNVTAYVNGSNVEVTISESNAGTLTITDGSNDTTKEDATAKVTLDQSGKKLTIEPKAAGTTSVTVKEGNADKTVTVNITVKATTLSADKTSVTLTYGGSSQDVTLSGDDAGDITIKLSTAADSTYNTSYEDDYISASVSNKKVTISALKAGGPVTLTAKEANGNSTVNIAVTVNKATPTIDLSSTSGAVNYDATNSFTATPKSTPAVNGTWTVTSSDGSKVGLVSGENTVAELTNVTATDNTATTITYKGTGATTSATTITVKFTPSDTNNYEEKSETYTVTAVNKIDATAPTLADTSNAYDGSAHTVNTTSEGSGGTLYYRSSTDGGNNYGSWQEAAPTITNRGDATNGVLYVQAYVKGDDNHNDSSIATAKATITSATTGITYTASGFSGTYDGQSHTVTVDVTQPTGTKVYYGTGAFSATLNNSTNTWTVKDSNNVEITSANESNYTGKPSETNVTNTEGKTYNWIIVPANGNYAPVTGSNKITITAKNISGTTIELTQTSFEYDGNTKTPGVTVKDTARSATLTGSGTDYTLTYSYDGGTTTVTNPSDAGTVTITITGQGNYTGTNSTTYTITRAKTATATADTTLKYNGSEQTGVSGEHVTITGNKATDADTYTATATPVDNYAWPDSVVTANSLATATSPLDISWTISPKEVDVTWGNTTFTYNGQAQGPTPNAESGVTGETLVLTGTTKIDAGTYTGTNASTASITSVTGGKTANYTLKSSTTTKNFTITAKSVTVTWTDPADGYTYNGSAQGPEISYASGVTGETLNVTLEYTSDNTNYTTTKPTNAGSYTARIKNETNSKGWTVTGGQAKAENYILTPLTHDYTIARAKTAGAQTEAEAQGITLTYTGGTLSGVRGTNVEWTTLPTGATESVIEATNAGTYTAYATPLANYAWSDGTYGTKKIEWSIAKKTISATTITLGQTSYTYDGTAKTPSVTVVDSTSVKANKTLVKDTDYTLSYSTDTTNVGSKTATITGIGNYKDTNSENYSISQAKPTVTLSPTTDTVDYNGTKTFTATPKTTPAVNGTWTVKSSGGSKVGLVSGENTVAELTNVTATDNTATTITYKGMAATTSSTTITVKFTPSNTTNYETIEKTFTVSAVNKIDATAPTLANTSNAYDGSAHTVDTTSQGAGGTLYYRSSTNGGNTYGSWQEAAPTITNIGDATNGVLYVQAYVKGDENHNDSSVVTATATITSATTGVQYTASNYSGTYDGDSHSISVNVSSPTGTTKYYSEAGALSAELDSSTNTWKVKNSAGSYIADLSATEKAKYTTAPTRTNVTNGAVTINWIIVPANGNYAPVTGSNTITITAKDISGTTITLSQTSFEYDGNDKEPGVTVTDTARNVDLTLTTDYTVGYSNNKNVGTETTSPTVTITGAGNYTGTNSTTFTITRQATAEASGDTTTLFYTGNSQNGTSGTNVNWSTTKGTRNEKDAGTYKAYATPDSNHAWKDNSGTEEREITWTISPKEVDVTWGTTTSFEYNGGEQAPTASAESGVTGETLTITRTTKIDAGTYTGTNASTATLTGVTGGQAKTANYTLKSSTTTKNFTITAKSITVTWTDPTDGYTYNGSAQGPTTTQNSGITGETINVTLNYKVKDAADSTYSATKPTNAGSYTAKTASWTVTGGQAKAGNYDLTPKTHDYTIARAKSSTATASGGEHTYTGSTITALSGDHITWRGDTSGINVKYVDNDPTKAIANYVAYATPEANYAWSDGSTTEKEITWKIVPKSVSANDIDIVLDKTNFTTETGFTYNGSTQAPSVTVQDNGRAGTEQTCATCSGSGNLRRDMGYCTNCRLRIYDILR